MLHGHGGTERCMMVQRNAESLPSQKQFVVHKRHQHPQQKTPASTDRNSSLHRQALQQLSSMSPIRMCETVSRQSTPACRPAGVFRSCASCKLLQVCVDGVDTSVHASAAVVPASIKVGFLSTLVWQLACAPTGWCMHRWSWQNLGPGPLTWRVSETTLAVAREERPGGFVAWHLTKPKRICVMAADQA